MASLIKKAQKRFTDLFVPYNLKYRPKSIYSKDDNGSVNFFEIYPSWKSTLSAPLELYNACTDYIQPPRHVDFPPAIVADVHGGRLMTTVSSTVIINRNNKIVHEVSYQYKAINIAASAEEYEIFRFMHFKEPQKIKGTVFNMLSGAGATFNYGHWLIDTIPRVHLLKRSGLFDQVDWFLVPTCKYDFNRDTLRLLDIPEEKILIGQDRMHIEADRIIGTSTPRFLTHVSPWIIEFLRDSFLNVSSETKYPPLIYINRKDTSIRQILNEDELIEMLKSFGFVEFELSKLPFAEKVTLFKSADAIVSAMGAGLTNLVFCQKNASLLEFFSEGFISTMFTQVAMKMGLDYNYLVFPSQRKTKTIKEGETDHFRVDIDKMKLMVEKMLSREMSKAEIK